MTPEEKILKQINESPLVRLLSESEEEKEQTPLETVLDSLETLDGVICF